MDCLLIKLRLKGIFAGLLLVGATSLQGIVLDWATNPWPGGTSATFTDVDGSGIDVSVSASLAGGVWHAPIGVGTYSDGDYLRLFPNWTTNNRERSYIDVTITFSQPVVGFGLRFSDIDVGSGSWGNYSWQDVIERARGFNGATLVTYATETSRGAGVQEWNPSDDGRLWYATQQSDWQSNSQLTLNWNNTPITSATFRYSSGPGARSDPVAQVIGFSNFTFYSAVPEAGTVVTAALMLLGLGAFSARRYVLRKKAISVQSLEARDHAS